MKKAKITCNVEAKNPMTNTSQRPGDIYMPDSMLSLMSVINSCADSYVRRAVKVCANKTVYEMKSKLPFAPLRI
jgi:hypothetical protein